MLMLMVSLTATVTFAQKISADKVPAAVKTAFSKEYPNTTVKWEMENGKYEAGFKSKGQIMSALYTPEGTKTETEVDIKITELPATVTSYVKTHYKGKTMKEAARITKADGTVNYEAEVNGMDVIFDSNGKFIKEAKD